MRQYGTTDVAHFIRLRVVIRQEPDCKEQSGSLFLSKGFWCYRYGRRFPRIQNTAQTCELGTTVILAGFSTMGITCGKTLPTAWCFTWNILYVLYTGSGKCGNCCRMFYVKHSLLSETLVWRVKRICSDTCRPSEIRIGIRPICFTWNNWESKHDNTKLGVNVRSKVFKIRRGVQRFRQAIEELSVCGKTLPIFWSGVSNVSRETKNLSTSFQQCG